MAIYVSTIDPNGLLNKIKESIETQSIQGWIVDEEGDLTHATQWRNRAWIRPNVRHGCLAFGLIGRKDENMLKQIYGIYHGLFSEVLLTYFDESIDKIELTSNKINGLDSFK